MGSSLRISTIGYLFGLALIVSGFIIIFSIWYMHQKIEQVDRTWHSFETLRFEKPRTLNLIHSELGYAGMIHNFKNYVIRQEPQYLRDSYNHLGGVLAAIRQYRVQGINEREKDALRDLEKTILAYSNALIKAEEKVTEGYSPEKIDPFVEVDDLPALKALDVLDQKARSRIKTRKDTQNRHQLVNELRQVMGYGGMIHHFKNLVLKKDSSLAAVILNKITKAESLISHYLAMPINSGEREALLAIRSVIKQYGDNIEIINVLRQEKKSISEIDKVVNVNDTPAVEGFRELNREINRYLVEESIDVNMSLDTVKALSWNTMIFITAYMAVFVFLTIWYLRSHIVRPIERMTTDLSRIAGGELEVEIIPNPNNNELGAMNRTIRVFRDSERARLEAVRALQRTESRLVAAIENIDDGFILCDENNQILMVNKKFARLYPNSRDLIKPGIRYIDILRGGAERGEFPRAIGRVDEWMAEIQSTLETATTSIELELIGGRWVRVSGVRIPTGGRLWIHSDITVSKQAELAMKEAKEAAEEASLAKSQFLASMSHELRTPLNAVIGYSEMLAEEMADLGQMDFIPDLQRITTAGKHLLSLINDILDLSKIEAGKIEYDLKTIMVADLVNEVAETVQSLIDKNTNQLVVNIAEDLGMMRTDPTRLRQILYNLLSNAAKFTQHGEVEMTARYEMVNKTRHIVFQIRDNGIGMTLEQQAKIFNAFEQADEKITRHYGGTGLGLSITEKFCHMLGGWIDVESEHGKGSVFTVRFPVVDEKDLVKKYVPAIKPDGGPVLLMIDDDPVALNLMRRQLTSTPERYQVATASDGVAGIELATELQPAAILLDVLMPQMDGWHVLQALKSNTDTQDIPVIMCTILDDQNKGYALGAAEYLTKPIDRERLVSVLRKYHCPVPPCRVLVVEDDEPTRELLMRSLASANWTVQTASNGVEGMEQLSKQQPDVILLDLMMPEMDGFEFVERLRENEQYRNIPVMVLTAKDLTPEDHQRLNGYVEQIIDKTSFNNDKLMHDIGGLLQKAVKGHDKNINIEPLSS